MKEDQQSMLSLVKIIEQYSMLYDHTNPAYSRRSATENAWAEVAQKVKRELNQECTVDELKMKWKGIRSSLNRFLNKVQNNHENIRKRYYLFDALGFLEPFIKKTYNSELLNESEERGEMVYINGEEYDGTSDSDITEVKHMIEKNISVEVERDCHPSDEEEPTICRRKRKKMGPEADPFSDNLPTNSHRNIGEPEPDMAFFRSILPDIKEFTYKQKRKLKIGILKLIDDIEDGNGESSSKQYQQEIA